MLFKFVLFSFGIFLTVDCMKLPNDIKPCRVRDPLFKYCVISRAKEALPSLIKGNIAYDIPRLDPLFLVYISLSPGSNMNFSLTGVSLYGLETGEITDAEFDEKFQTLTLNVTLARAELIGQYRLEGKVLSVPLIGSGPANITLINPKFGYQMHYELNKRNFKEYMVLKQSSVKGDITKAYIKLNNLFSGNTDISSALDSVIENEWKQIYEEIGPAIDETINRVLGDILGKIWKKIPYREMFEF